ncbi:DEAD/DEAH box helicase [Aquibacillus sp. 3ASR75-11]|uniref:DEAD/DEAH box helicase n=1 Tax=Terrihalobacillus insolitus TaxID=2950438 RepID=A0A9X4ALW6_9BACI|nr:DEAD/DEAH box helicase [Terrihalobacillus insolitus]MDC3424194.1 DEAD/DEAH box helicase [Terrihalobacillus insolitus]
MKGLLIFKDEIKELFSSTVYRRGLTYFNQGRVKGLYYLQNGDSWFAKVMGTEIYHVNVTIGKNRIDYGCSCMAYETFSQCKHVVACLLEIAKEQKGDYPHFPSGIQKTREQQVITHFIETFSNFQQIEAYNVDHIGKQPLQVEFFIKTPAFTSYSDSNLWTIEVKVGLKRTYVIKNLKEFLTDVEMRRNHFFTKMFTYDPTEHVFTKEDNEVIQLLIDVTKNEVAYRDPYYSYRRDERVITIPPMIVDELLAKLQSTTFTFECQGEVYPQIQVLEGQTPLTFQLDKGSQEGFRLNISELTSVRFFDLYGFVLKHQFLYKLSLSQQKIISDLYTGLLPTRSPFNENNFLTIATEQMETFLSIVVPEMKKIGNLNISEQVANQIRQYPLEAKILVDRTEETLLVDVEYHYGDVIMNPFQANSADVDESNGLIIRDAKKEQEIMYAIENGSLKYNGKKLYVEGEEEIYYFLYHTLALLEDKASIFLTNAVKALLLPEKNTPSTTFDFNSDGSLLEVSFDMKDIGQEHIQNILQSVIEKKKYYRLPSGAFVSIEGNEQMQNIQQLYSDLNMDKSELQNGMLQLPVYRALQLDEMIGEADKHKVRIGKQFRKLIQNLKNPDELDFDLPADLHAELRDYQEIGFQWFKTLAHYSLGGILADDMGLGKTLQSIAYLLSEQKDSQKSRTSLVVAPASLVYNWKSEIERFASSLEVEVIIGTPTERQALLTKEVMPDVLVTSYPLLRQDIDYYKEIQFHSLFLDEAQAIKNIVTKTSKAVRSIRAHKRFALSGTPIENSLDELWAIFQVIMPGFFPSQPIFRKMSDEKISKMVRPFILRRLKKDVLTELPDKIETTHVSDLKKEQKELYMGYLERIQAETKESLQGEGLNKSRIKILAGLTRLRQLCCHPSLFIDNYEGSSGKLEQLIEIVGNARENQKRMLIFSQFTSMLHIIRDELTKAGVSFFYIDGSTPSKDRVDMVNRFNEGENDIFLISLKAGGTGLNLTGADTVILYDLWWNPAVEDQAAGRAHRMGQKNVVQVIRLLTKGTIEEKIYQLQQRKKELIEKVIQPGETMLSSITEDEIRELLSI